MTVQIAAVMSDIVQSFLQPRLWIHLAWRDMRLQYERSLLGVLWITLQSLAWVVAIVFVFGDVIAPYREYAVYVAIGIVLYNFVTQIVMDSSEIFIRNRIIIHSHPNPFFAYVLKHLIMSLIQLFLQSFVIIGAIFFVRWTIDPIALMAVPGLIIAVAMGGGLSLLLALIGLRYGDFRFALQASMRLGLFVTPVLWIPTGEIGLKKLAADVNPITHFLAIIRDPLMGSPAPMLSYYVTISLTLLVSALGFIVFSRLRATIPMWL